MNVSGRKSGKFGTRNAPTLGVSVGRQNAKQFFDPKWAVVFIELDGTTVPVNITDTFWTSFPELRSSLSENGCGNTGLPLGTKATHLRCR